MRPTRRGRALPLIAATFLTAALLGPSAATAAPNDPCNAQVSDRAYTECRLDRIEAKQDQIIAAQQAQATPAPSPSASATPTVTSTPSSSPTPSTTPTPTPTRSATPSPTPSSTPTATTRPSAANTGVPAGTTLSNYTGPATITTTGTVIDSKRVTSCIVIKANNVTIKNSLVVNNGCFFNILSDNGNTGLVITDTEVDGAGNGTGDSAINGQNWTCTRCNIHGTVDGVKAGNNVVLQDSFVHDLVISNDSHNDGVQSLGTASLKVLRNTIVLADGATSAVILSTGSADEMRNVQIDSNYLGGGAFTVYGGYQAGTDDKSKVSNIAVTNNQFTTAIFPRSGAYGPLTSVDSPVVVSGNTWADGPNKGKAIS